MKYKLKLWSGEPERNSFQVGDMVRVFDLEKTYDVKVLEINGAGVQIQLPETGYFMMTHFRQCRPLEEDKLREFGEFGRIIE